MKTKKILTGVFFALAVGCLALAMTGTETAIYATGVFGVLAVVFLMLVLADRSQNPVKIYRLFTAITGLAAAALYGYAYYVSAQPDMFAGLVALVLILVVGIPLFAAFAICAAFWIFAAVKAKKLGKNSRKPTE